MQLRLGRCHQGYPWTARGPHRAPRCQNRVAFGPSVSHHGVLDGSGWGRTRAESARMHTTQFGKFYFPFLEPDLIAAYSWRQYELDGCAACCCCCRKKWSCDSWNIPVYGASHYSHATKWPKGLAARVEFERLLEGELMASTLKDAKARYRAQGCCERHYAYTRFLYLALNCGGFCPEASKLLNPTGDPDGLRCKPVYFQDGGGIGEGEATDRLVLAVVPGPGGTANSNGRDVEPGIAAAAQAGAARRSSSSLDSSRRICPED